MLVHAARFRQVLELGAHTPQLGVVGLGFSDELLAAVTQLVELTDHLRGRRPAWSIDVVTRLTRRGTVIALTYLACERDLL